MFVIHDANYTPPEESATDPNDWVEKWDQAGVRIAGDRLVPAGKAKLVRVRNGELKVSNGPLTDQPQQIDGFDILECENLEQAIEVASAHPMAKRGIIELRAFWQD